ncbi:MAG: hypothetical protein PHW76_07765 [Alphaproteobacteria bacterium]|nr:hypothetical protein [Alphaproteobacteria bacterium]
MLDKRARLEDFANCALLNRTPDKIHKEKSNKNSGKACRSKGKSIVRKFEESILEHSTPKSDFEKARSEQEEKYNDIIACFGSCFNVPDSVRHIRSQRISHWPVVRPKQNTTGSFHKKPVFLPAAWFGAVPEILVCFPQHSALPKINQSL